MTRTDRAKVTYLLVLLGLGALAWFVLDWLSYDLRAAALLAVVLVLPGRLQGIVLRELFRGRRWLDRGEPEQSLAHTRRFLEQLAEQPARRYAVWLGGWVYTPSAEAMALHNLAVAHSELGELDVAEEELDKALAVDPSYPLPWVQKAVIATTRGDKERVKEALLNARHLGYRDERFDRIVRRGKALLARLEGVAPGRVRGVR